MSTAGNAEALRDYWDNWSRSAGTNYPSERVIQYTLRSFTPQQRRGAKALDVGCGSGSNCWFLAREGFEVAATDISPVALAQARRRLEQNNLSGHFQLAPAHQQPFPDSSFDYVISVGVLELLNNPHEQDAMVGECSRVLKPGGRGLLVFSSRLHFGFLAPERNGNIPFYPPEDSAVRQMFDSRRFSAVSFDREIITRESGLYKEDHHLVTFIR